jgi:C_GCAxxG_C_C family probable redox protein
MIVNQSIGIMIDESIKLAKNLFSGKYNCSQSSMKAILVALNLDFGQTFHLAAGMGAGIAHEGNVCGAVSGAILALGVIEGTRQEDTLGQKEAAYASGEEFVRRFKKKHDTILCDQLTGITMTDLNARSKASKDGLFAEKCPSFVADAVRIALEIATENKD